MTNSQYSEQQKRVSEEQGEPLPGLCSQSSAGCLTTSLTRLRKSLIERTNADVEREFGKDSMIASSLAEADLQMQRATTEIEAYCCILVDEEVARNNYVPGDDGGFLDWLLRLRFEDRWEQVKQQRVEYYRSFTPEERRMKFVSLLHRSLPESARAPLVLFRLFPRSVRIAVAMAFGDIQRAQALREEQLRLLPAIGFCHECHGRLMDCDDSCRCCGNPVWTIAWLQSE